MKLHDTAQIRNLDGFNYLRHRFPFGATVLSDAQITFFIPVMVHEEFDMDVDWYSLACKAVKYFEKTEETK